MCCCSPYPGLGFHLTWKQNRTGLGLNFSPKRACFQVLDSFWGCILFLVNFLWENQLIALIRWNQEKSCEPSTEGRRTCSSFVSKIIDTWFNQSNSMKIQIQMVDYELPNLLVPSLLDLVGPHAMLAVSPRPLMTSFTSFPQGISPMCDTWFPNKELSCPACHVGSESMVTDDILYLFSS